MIAFFSNLSCHSSFFTDVFVARLVTCSDTLWLRILDYHKENQTKASSFSYPNTLSFTECLEMMRKSMDTKSAIDLVKSSFYFSSLSEPECSTCDPSTDNMSILSLLSYRPTILTLSLDIISTIHRIPIHLVDKDSSLVDSVSFTICPHSIKKNIHVITMAKSFLGSLNSSFSRPKISLTEFVTRGPHNCSSFHFHKEHTLYPFACRNRTDSNWSKVRSVSSFTLVRHDGSIAIHPLLLIVRGYTYTISSNTLVSADLLETPVFDSLTFSYILHQTFCHLDPSDDIVKLVISMIDYIISLIHPSSLPLMFTPDIVRDLGDIISNFHFRDKQLLSIKPRLFLWMLNSPKSIFFKPRRPQKIYTNLCVCDFEHPFFFFDPSSTIPLDTVIKFANPAGQSTIPLVGKIVERGENHGSSVSVIYNNTPIDVYEVIA